MANLNLNLNINLNNSGILSAKNQNLFSPVGGAGPHAGLNSMPMSPQ